MGCITPFGVKDRLTMETIPVPCGKCPECVKRRVSAWSFRLMQEEKRSSSAWFITLTYSTIYVPITRNGFMSINKVDCQKFLKRLRKAHPKDVRLKYFLAGEYGGRTNRPHYHLILFNADIKLIAPAWDLGQIHFGQVSGASIGYTLKYMSKDAKIPMHKNDDREPEFRLMSKKLGAGYLTDAMVKWHKAKLDDRMYCNLEDGRKISMPRYYKDKIYNEWERKRVAFFARQKMVKEDLEEFLLNRGNEKYWHNKKENHLAAFKAMHQESIKNQKF